MSAGLFGNRLQRLGLKNIPGDNPPRKNDGVELPALIGKSMKKANVVIGATLRSFSHTIAREEDCRAGAMPGITEDIVQRTLSADYESIAVRSRKLTGILTEGNTAYLTTAAGSDIRMSLAGRAGKPDTVIIHNPSSRDFSNLPAGKAYIAPVEGTANGDCGN